MIAKTIAHYTILQKLGEGGMGEVYLAEDTELDRKVALKFLPPQYTEDPEINARFKREAKAAAALNHPNIITIYEVGKHEGQMFIAMEYVEGQDLYQIKSPLGGAAASAAGGVTTAASKPLAMDAILNYTAQICEGLAAAHKKGIVHRDIKPANILLNSEGRVKIADFGLAKQRDVTRLTRESSTFGTLCYMSPEQIQSANVDQRSDIFSVGVVLYEMITGRLPFKGDYEAAVSYSILHEEPEPLARYKTGVSDELQRIVEKTLDKDKETRYQNIADLLADLKGFSKERTTKADAGQRKNKRLLIFAGVGLLAALAIFITLSVNNLNFQTEKPDAVTTGESQWQNSIAVLPFENISPDPEQEFFCDGMTEQIITNLSQLQALKVIARTSVMKFKNTEKTIPEIAEELRVVHILEGSIRKVGKRIRVTAQLIQADGGYHLWAKDYDRELEDIFAVQDAVSGEIARALLKELTPKEFERLTRGQPGNVEAYEYYLKGKYLHENEFGITVTRKDFKRSESMYKQAIKLDSNYAEAYAGLANLYNSYVNATGEEGEYASLQQEYIETAFRLDPNSALVNVVKGWVHAYKGETADEYESYKRALQLNPNEPENNFAMGFFLRSRGLHHHAIKYYTKAMVLDPLRTVNYRVRASSYACLRDIHDQMLDYQKELEIEPNSIGALSRMAETFILLKKYPEADEFLAKSEKVNPDYRRLKFIRAMLYTVQGTKEEALQSLKLGGYDSRFYTIVIYSLLDLQDEAIKLIDKKPVGGYLIMLNHLYFDNIRDTEEFQAALQKAKEIYEQNLIKYSEVFL